MSDQNADELYDFSVDAMTEPIERLFEREFPTDFGIFLSGATLSDSYPGARPIDLLYLAGSPRSLHAIKLLSSYDSCLFDVHEGIHALRGVRCNLCWIGLPLDEFREGEVEYNAILEKTCSERGIGILTVQPRGRGLSAKIISSPERDDGDHLDSYAGLRGRWRDLKAGSLAVDGFQVVDYYGR
jgi:hypothetical protein